MNYVRLYDKVQILHGVFDGKESDGIDVTLTVSYRSGDVQYHIHNVAAYHVILHQIVTFYDAYWHNEANKKSGNFDWCIDAISINF